MGETGNLDGCRVDGCQTPDDGYAGRGLCHRHEQAGAQALGLLGRDWADLQPLVWDPASGATRLSTINVPYGPTEPGDWNVDALIGEIGYTLVLWETVVRDRAGLSEVSDRDHASGAAVARAVNVLLAHFPVLVAVPPWVCTSYDRVIGLADGPDAVLAFLRLHRRAQGRLGVREVATELPGHCPACGRARLVHRNGSNAVRCAHCQAAMSWDDYQALAGVLQRARR